MTSRALIVLVAALAVLALLAVYGQRGDSPRSVADQQLFPELEAALPDIDRVRVVGAGAETLATLERRADSWVIAQKHDYPADIATLRGALRGLAEARIVEEKTSNPAYYDRLGVDAVESQDAFGVELTAYAGDAVRAAVVIGDTAGSGLQYVRASNDAASYLVDREIDVPRDAIGWIERGIVDIPGNRIAAVTIEHPDGEVVRLTKADAEQTSFIVEDIPEGRELSYPGVANVTGNTLRDLRLEDVAAAGSDLPDAATRTTFTTFDGLVVTAMSFELDGERWVRIAASVDTAGAGPRGDAPAPSGTSADAAADDSADDSAQAVADAAADAAPPEPAEAPVPSSAAADAAAEAERINARTAGWQYRIAPYQLDQLTRRMDDLLSDPDDA